MTQSHVGNPLYVAAARRGLAEMFASNNGVAPTHLHFISEGNMLRGGRVGQTIYVIGEIGRSVAEEIHLRVQYRGAKVVYVDVWDKIHA